MQETLIALSAPLGSSREVLRLTVGDALGLFLLLVALAANLFQLYRARLARKAAADAVLAAITDATGMIGRSRAKAEALGPRLWSAERAGGADAAVLREFREFVRETEFGLRAHYELLRGVARIVRAGARAERGAEFGPPGEQVERAQRTVGF